MCSLAFRWRSSPAFKTGTQMRLWTDEAADPGVGSCTLTLFLVRGRQAMCCRQLRLLARCRFGPNPSSAQLMGGTADGRASRGSLSNSGILSVASSEMISPPALLAVASGLRPEFRCSGAAAALHRSATCHESKYLQYLHLV